MNRMAQQPDWTKIGVIAACIIGVATVVGEVLPYFYPPDPQHPLHFDFIQNQISFSVSVGMLMLGAVGIGAVSFAVVMIGRRRKAIGHLPTVDLTFPDNHPALTPLSPEYLALETDRDNQKKLYGEAILALGHMKQELEEAQKQLETPKIVLSVVRFDVYEEVAKNPLTEDERLIYWTNNRILVRVHLKISNAHRVYTNIQGLGMTTRNAPHLPPAQGGPPTQFPEILRQPIKFGLPVDVSLDFWIDHADAQTIVKNYFVVAAQDGTGQHVETEPQHISRVLPMQGQATTDALPSLLRFEGLGAPEDLCLAVPLGVCTVQSIVIKNAKLDVPIVARNARAEIDYVHDDKTDRFIHPGIWRNVSPTKSGANSNGMFPSIFLSSNEAQKLIFAMQMKDGSVVTCPDDYNKFDEFKEGHWTLKITISTDTGAPLQLTGGFTVTVNRQEDRRLLILDNPAFT